MGSISGYSFATPACTGACGSQDLDTLNANIASTAPASICVNAGMWNDYVGGVMTTEACGGYAYDDLDHCVQLTGFNLTAAEPYYMVRNSWATNWGEDGYILLSAEETPADSPMKRPLLTLSSEDETITGGSLNSKCPLDLSVISILLRFSTCM